MPAKPTKIKRSAYKAKPLFKRPGFVFVVAAALIASTVSVAAFVRTQAADSINPPTSLRVSAPSPTKVVLNWIPSTSTPSPSYNIFRNDVQIGVMGVWISLDGSVSYTDNTVSPGTTYSYKVQAQNINGTGTSNTVTITTSAAPTAEQLGTIQGVVTDKRKNPVAGASVSLVYYGQSNEAKTDANGNYSLTGVPAGSYTLNVTAPGHISTTKKITVTGGSTLSVNLSIRAR